MLNIGKTTLIAKKRSISLSYWIRLQFLQCYVIGYIRTLKGIAEMQFVLSNSE